MPAPILHQFAISHFCEKVRWALEYKGIKYVKNSMVPGLHSPKAKKLATTRQLPILEMGEGQVIQGSAAILDHLDLIAPERLLISSDPALAAEARDWEQRIDDALGAAVRRVCYDTLLNHKSLTISLLGEDASWYGKPFLSLIYPKLVPMMRNMLTIEPEAVEASKQVIMETIEALAHARGDSLFLVGDAFSRADISAASMLAPLTLEPRYGVPWPAQMPEPLNSFSEELKPKLDWVDSLYAEWRPAR